MVRTAALTGTPGTGKTTLQRAASEAGWSVVDVSELARAHGAVHGRDRRRRVDEVDIDALKTAWDAEVRGRGPDDRVLAVGHLAQHLPCDIVVVLRCSPRVLRERLRARGYPEDKVAENVEAEAVDIVLLEALDSAPPGGVHEIDTTTDPPDASAELLLRILDGEDTDHGAGGVDWSGEVLGWF